MIRLLLLAALAVLSGCRATPGPAPVVVAVGAGGYATVLPPGARPPSDASGNPAVPLVTDAFHGAVPTNDWWTSLVWDFDGHPFSRDLYAHPLVFRADAGGLHLRYPTTVHVDDAAYAFDRTNDLHVGLDGLAAPATRVEAATDWTVTAVWEDGARRLAATIGHGLPFAYFTRRGADVVLSFAAPPDVWYDRNGTLGLTVNGHAYGVFAPPDSDWTGETTLRSDLGGADVLSVAVLPDASPETLAFFRRHAFAFVTDTRVDWAYDEPSATLTTTYTAAAERVVEDDAFVDIPLLALYPHQWRHLAGTDAPLTGDAYVSPRGPMRLLGGGTFQTQLRFGGLLPAVPDDCDAAPDSLLYAYVDAVHRQADLFPGPLGQGDTYWTGKGLGRLAELVPLADRAGHAAARDRFLGVLRETLGRWLSADDGLPLFYYDPVWTTLIGYPAEFGSGTDLNDHHFHYGYFLHAAATLARYDPAWAADDRWGAMVDLLVRDVANPRRDDDRFPFLRTLDPYAGHSWASGHAAFDDEGNNQESSSEALNFAAGLVRWGVERGDDALRDLGIYLFATELSAVEAYWFDVEGIVFPEDFDHTNVAMVWGNGGRYDTWFGSDPAFIHGINFLPFTGASFYLGRHPEYVRANLAELRRRQPAPGTWPDLILQYQALADPRAARDAFADLLAAGYTPEAGETTAHTYAWIEALAGLGQVDTTVTADVPTYAVFRDGDARRYVAYNPGPDERRVRFSDGFTTTVPPGEMRTSCPGEAN